MRIGGAVICQLAHDGREHGTRLVYLLIVACYDVRESFDMP